MTSNIPAFPKFDGVSGAAFLLRTPVRKSIEIRHPDGIVTIREGAPYVTVILFESQPPSKLKSSAWRIIQEAFDFYAATYREPLSTQHGEQEYLLWIRESDGYHLTCVDSVSFAWSVNIQASTLSVPSSPVSAQFIHHPALRFYRLSQLTDDLFDACRNAYLCLECLVSDESRKGAVRGESELEWLKRVLGGPLSVALPSDIDINSMVEDIYKRGRNRIFHAKYNEEFYSPHGEDREEVQVLFERLTYLIFALFRHKFGSFIGGWGSMSTGASDAQARATFQFDEVVFKCQGMQASSTPTIEIVDQPRRFGNLWARITTDCPTQFVFMDGIELFTNGKSRFGFFFAESLPLTQVCKVTLELNLLQYHARAPKPIHAV